VILSLFAVLLTTGCPDGTVTQTGLDGGEDGGATAGDTADSTTGRDGGDDGDVDEADDGGEEGDADVQVCDEARTCGDDCCTGGESCVDGTCLPACGGTRCGEQSMQCCTGDEVCLYNQCATPGKSCRHDRQCPDGKICEPTLSKCIPDPGITCEFRPSTGALDPKVEMAWSADANTPAPSYKQVMMTPSVADIDGSGSPDIVFSTFRSSNYNEASVLRAIDGETFKPLFHLTDPAKRVSGSASVAIGDIDVDGRNELVGVRPGADGLIAFDDHTTNWKVMWEAGGFSMSWDSAVLVDLNADGKVEVLGANRVFEATTGKQLCAGQGVEATPRNSTAVDVDGDGDKEVVAGGGVFDFKADGSGGYTCPQLYDLGSSNGYPSVGDFGTFTGGSQQFGQTDGKPEIAVVQPTSGGTVRLYNGQTGQRIWSSSIPNTGHPHFSASKCNGAGAGPPTVADFDGDDQPEVATAGACFYAVFETDGQLLWKHPSQDFSSSQTGSSVFDFEGDGAAEAVYADECFLRVYKGSGNGNGQTDIYLKYPHSSGTTRELPVIVDVDNDFHAEIVQIANNYSGVSGTCQTHWNYDASSGPKRGIMVVEDAKNRWVPTRPIWNQHAYHVTNVCDGVNDDLCVGRNNTPGAIPVGQKQNWSVNYLNNFRQNVQGEGIFDAPDLRITEIEPVNARCGDDGSLTVDVEVTVANRGARGVAAGATTEVFAQKGSNNAVSIGTVQTTSRLLPGQSETVSMTWQVPMRYETGMVDLRATADADMQFNECKEKNNDRRESFSELSSLPSTLEIDTLAVADANCAASGSIDIDVTVTNPSTKTIASGAPVVVQANLSGQQPTQIDTLTTGQALSPGSQTTLTTSWTVPSRYVNTNFDVEAIVDPDGEVFACGAGTSSSQQAKCEVGG
jgi:hypothetical protein